MYMYCIREYMFFSERDRERENLSHDVVYTDPLGVDDCQYAGTVTVVTQVLQRVSVYI